jgi:hypothetical protein
MMGEAAGSELPRSSACCSGVSRNMDGFERASVEPVSASSRTVLDILAPNEILRAVAEVLGIVVHPGHSRSIQATMIPQV